MARKLSDSVASATGPRGRGVAYNPPSRFERLRIEPLEKPVDRVPTQYMRDSTRSIIARNNSPDVPFDASLNPYRGCEHGCVYCYARPTHEYLGFSAGLDFETRILVKTSAPDLLRKELASPSWQPQLLSLSGVTDPYQPIERRLEVARRCLQVLADFRNPVAIVTKNKLVARDLDILSELARDRAAMVFVGNHLELVTIGNYQPTPDPLPPSQSVWRPQFASAVPRRTQRRRTPVAWRARWRRTLLGRMPELTMAFAKDLDLAAFDELHERRMLQRGCRYLTRSVRAEMQHLLVGQRHPKRPHRGVLDVLHGVVFSSPCARGSAPKQLATARIAGTDTRSSA